MADEQDRDDRTEEATPERREQFREKGQIPVSREITSVFILAALTLLMANYLGRFLTDLMAFMSGAFHNIEYVEMSKGATITTFKNMWLGILWFIFPFFLVGSVIAIFMTFFQTQLNWSWKRLTPDFKRLNPLAGIARMAGADTFMELFKGIAKLSAVGLVSFLILKGEWVKVPGLLSFSISKAWSYWGEITLSLFYAVAGLLLLVGGLDYIYTFRKVEGQMKMTKQEVKDEFKNREVDQQVKARIRRMGRDIAMSKVIQAVPDSTVVITNPDHYAIAIYYELGMPAPMVVAKGVDHIAQKMKEIAKENEVPIVENKPLARTLYKLVEVGHEIPESLYRAVSEVIRYVFLLKGKHLSK